MNFMKMEGLGNDFIVTHEISAEWVNSVGNHAVKLCDRRFGIGADGIIFVLPSQTADFKMRIINSDGSEPEMCGNGIRCFALYCRMKNLTKSDKLSIETLAGIIRTEITGGNDVKVNMGQPILNPELIPVLQKSGPVLMKELIIDDKVFKINAVSMGNPHAVIYADDLTDDLVLGYGPKIEKDPHFPKKTNVEFIKVLSDKEIQMRVYERGCGETMACGTGACASVVSGVINKLHGKSVTVHLKGGDLQIEWSGKEGDAVMMSGPANRVFEGSVEFYL